jgi:transposase
MIELVESGRSPAQLAREFGITAQASANGVAQAAIDKGKRLPGKDGLSSAEREDLNRLRRESRGLQMERDILARAAAWCAARACRADRPR